MPRHLLKITKCENRGSYIPLIPGILDSWILLDRVPGDVSLVVLVMTESAAERAMVMTD